LKQDKNFWFIALINGFIGFGALYGVAGMVALFGGADVVTSGFSAGEPYPPRLHVKPPSNKLSMLYHHTKVRIPKNFYFPISQGKLTRSGLLEICI